MDAEKMDHMKGDFHMDYWREVRDRSAKQLAELCDSQGIPETRMEVHGLLETAIVCGNSSEVAQAVMCASEWVHAENELTYKKRQK